MVSRNQKNLESDYNNTSQRGEGIDLSCAEKVWITIAQSECRIDLLVKLISLKIGLKELEEYSESLNIKLRSNKLKSNSEKDMVNIILEGMRLKLRDEKLFHGEKLHEKNKIRRELNKTFGENTRRTRTIVKNLRLSTAKEKLKMKKKYEKKVEFLEKKYRREEEGESEEVPKDLENYKDAKVFSRKTFEEIEKNEISVAILGDIEVSDQVRQLLKLHPKFSIMQRLDETDYETDLELAFAKLRYQLLQELGEKLSEEEENTLRQEANEEIEEKMEEEEAKTRSVFDAVEKRYDNRKKRVTDLKENSRVVLPKPLPPPEEAGIEMRREIYKKLFRSFLKKNCRKTEDEEKGLKELKKKLKEGELIIMLTDKSGKFALTDRETYLEMGKPHIEKDKQIDRNEIKEIEKQINGHTSMWIKMTNQGENHNHEGRTRESKISRSNNLAQMRLLLKDHKENRATRAVVSGCDSNTLGLSNVVSELLEAFCNCVEKPFEVISSEDLLARLHECNRKIEENRQERIEEGEEIDTEEELIMFGSDVVGLFPSMTEARTGKIIRIETEKSGMKVDGLDYSQIALYISINRDKTGDLQKLERLLPWRKGKRGTKPGMKNKEITRKERNTTTTWIFPDRTPTEEEMKLMRSRMCEIGVRVLWSNFCYTFGGNNYLQQHGGPIGARITMASARLVMHNWAATWTMFAKQTVT